MLRGADEGEVVCEVVLGRGSIQTTRARAGDSAGEGPTGAPRAVAMRSVGIVGVSGTGGKGVQAGDESAGEA